MALPEIYEMQLLQASGCHLPAAATAAASMTWPAYVDDLLACHALTVAGHGHIDGAAAVRLVTAGGAGSSPDSAVLWVSRSSYLPLRLALQPLPGVSGASGYQIDLRWLPLTAANLAKARILPPPAGFRRLG